MSARGPPPRDGPPTRRSGSRRRQCPCKSHQGLGTHTSGPSLHHVDTRHHRVVLVFPVVAVEHVPTAKLLETKQHQHFLSAVERDRVLPPALVRKRRFSIAFENLKMRQ